MEGKMSGKSVDILMMLVLCIIISTFFNFPTFQINEKTFEKQKDLLFELNYNDED